MSVNADSPANRLKSYKNKALDSQELRRRREEEGIQLRKQKRDEQVNTIFQVMALVMKNINMFVCQETMKILRQFHLQCLQMRIF